jgi:hypothetical protein
MWRAVGVVAAVAFKGDGVKKGRHSMQCAKAQGCPNTVKSETGYIYLNNHIDNIPRMRMNVFRRGTIVEQIVDALAANVHHRTCSARVKFGDGSGQRGRRWRRTSKCTEKTGLQHAHGKLTIN